MDRAAIEKVCELQKEIDGYRRFVCDFLVSIIKRECRQFVAHDETSDASIIQTIWDEYYKLIQENKDLKDRLARDLKDDGSK